MKRVRRASCLITHPMRMLEVSSRTNTTPPFLTTKFNPKMSQNVAFTTQVVSARMIFRDSKFHQAPMVWVL